MLRCGVWVCAVIQCFGFGAALWLYGSIAAQGLELVPFRLNKPRQGEKTTVLLLLLLMVLLLLLLMMMMMIDKGNRGDEGDEAFLVLMMLMFMLRRGIIMTVGWR